MANIRYQFMTDFPYNIKIERIYVWNMEIEIIIHLNVGREFVNLSGSPAMPGKKKNESESNGKVRQGYYHRNTPPTLAISLKGSTDSVLFSRKWGITLPAFILWKFLFRDWPRYISNGNIARHQTKQCSCVVRFGNKWVCTFPIISSGR